jgi:hypothetical protein
MGMTLEAYSKDCEQENLDRGEKNHRMVMINTNEHNNLFAEVQFQ